MTLNAASLPALRFLRRYTAQAYDEMDRARQGALTESDRAWNLCVFHRIREILTSMVGFIQRNDLDQLTVVNMSGLNGGKPDPVLFDLLCRTTGCLRLSWFVVDHPQSDTFTQPSVRGWLNERGIVPVPRDHRHNSGTVPVPPADVVLCTEVLEHLDYSDGLKLLRSCRDVLRPGGMLIITTPNPLFLGYRVLFAFGRWDFLHFNDTPDEVERGLVGHTIYYDPARLERLLLTSGFRSVHATTFNAGHGPGEYRTLPRRLAASTLRLLTHVVPRSGQVTKVVAYR